MLRTEYDLTGLLLDALNTGVAVVDQAFRVLAWNAWLASASGIPAVDAIGRTTEELFPGRRLHRLTEAIRDAVESGASRLLTHTLHDALLPLRSRAGGELLHNVSVQPLGPKSHGRCVIQVTDVTVPVRREQVLRERQNARYHAVVGSAWDAILTLDDEARVQFANPAAAAELGYTAEELIGRPSTELFETEDAWAAVLTAAREGGVLSRAVELTALRKDGSQTFLEASAAKWVSDSRVFVTAILRIVNERRAVEEALRSSQRRLDAVLNNATVGVILLDDGQRCSYMNAAAEKITGFSLDETQGRVMHDVVHHTRPDGSHFPLEDCPIDQAFPENAQMQGEEVFVHKDGSFYPVSFTASPVHDDTSRTIGTILEIRDIRAEKRAQAHQRLLINELNHRVKNTLATVQSIAAQTLRSASGLEAARDALEQRLMALSRTHDVLTRENWESADLRDVVAGAVAPYASGGVERIQVSGPELRLAPRRALALAMALQELLTNAVKYGALSNSVGRIHLSWSLEGADNPGRFQLCWEESGGPEVSVPTRRGFGTRLIERSLAQDLDAIVQMEFAPSGLVCRVDAPLGEG